MRLSAASIFAMSSIFLSTSLLAAESPESTIRSALRTLQPTLTVEAVAPSPISGLYEVKLPNGERLYASPDGQYILQGNLYQVAGQKVVNLTGQARAQIIVEQLAQVPSAQKVTFPAEGTAKTFVTVFTDTDCPYCQRLHEEVPALNKQGVEVRYMAFPRQGMSSAGARTLENIWCSDNPQQAMTAAKSSGSVAQKQCANPVAEQFELGQRLGVQGTPAIFLENGTMIPGYQPADRLAAAALAAAKAK